MIWSGMVDLSRAGLADNLRIGKAMYDVKFGVRMLAFFLLHLLANAVVRVI